MIGAKLFPLLIYASSWLGGPVVCVSNVEDFIVFNSACYYGGDYVNDNLSLRDLVAASDVIIKAFAGDGNYLRPVLAASGGGENKVDSGSGGSGREEGKAEAGSRHRKRSRSENGTRRDVHGNGGNGNASSISEEDFIVRLEPTVVYKGNDVFKKLKLINWQHYVVIKSIASNKFKLNSMPTGPTGNKDKMHPSKAPSITSSAARNKEHIGSYRSKCNRSRVITGSINNSEEAHVESRTNNNTTEDNKVSSKSNSNNSNQHHSNEHFAEDTTREQLTVSNVFSEILPTELIIFGRLDDRSNLQVDLLSGLLLWDKDLESSLWHEIGWSDWSEYTPCSVSCGKGVQQRFRHCLKRPEPELSTARSRRMSSTQATPFRHKPYVNIEQEPRKDGMMNNENVNPSSSFTTPLTTSTLAQEGDREGQSVPVGSTLAFTGDYRETEEKEEEEEEEYDGDGIEPPAMGEDTSTSTADLHSGIERRFNESTNANSGERSIQQHPASRRRFRGVFLQRENQHKASGDDDSPPSSNSTVTNTADGKGHITVTTDSGCEGFNIEQRICNMFECAGSIDLLSTSFSHQSTVSDVWKNRLNYEVNQIETNFTLMLNLRSKKQHHLGSDSSEHHTNKILSLRSQLATSSSLSINFVNDGHGGLKVIQEKFGLSEMLPVERNLLDGKWHSVALSGRNGSYINVYIDCLWANSFILSRGAIELPQYPVIEAGRDIELQQLTLVPGSRERLHCAADTIPITDTENRQVTNYFEGIN